MFDELMLWAKMPIPWDIPDPSTTKQLPLSQLKECGLRYGFHAEPPFEDHAYVDCPLRASKFPKPGEFDQRLLGFLGQQSIITDEENDDKVFGYPGCPFTATYGQDAMPPVYEIVAHLEGCNRSLSQPYVQEFFML
ncbi:SubName: Full=Uncharacterized protein {ECO:0000313/EMBL:CCA66455.1} [Serendipita indica DSM 11827]|nr:SubName: Full=Uncharacterized protein {ECO:0000313/EMBL:CCA66455.1} [Serendipita indica DSM 11827]